MVTDSTSDTSPAPTDSNSLIILADRVDLENAYRAGVDKGISLTEDMFRYLLTVADVSLRNLFHDLLNLRQPGYKSFANLRADIEKGVIPLDLPASLVPERGTIEDSGGEPDPTGEAAQGDPAPGRQDPAAGLSGREGR